jgi:hypothetical protein
VPPGTVEWPGKRPDGTFHPVYLAQVKAEWFAARDHLDRSAYAGREAQKIWNEAVDREMNAHRRMREILEAAGEPLPGGCSP